MSQAITAAPIPHSSGRYTRALTTLHWVMAVLVLLVIVVIEAREFVDRSNPLRANLKSVHFMFGLLVLAMTGLRLYLRAISPVPPIVPKPAAWQIAASHLTHALFYGLLIVMPILGWMVLSGLGRDIPFFGFSLPPIMGEDKEFAHSLEEIHETLGNVMIVLIGVHAAAALYHHFIAKDNTLTRMLPGR